MRTRIKIAVCVVSGFALLVTGYCSGLVVQHKLDTRFAAVWEVGEAMKLHKALAVENYDYARHEVMCHMMHGAMHLNDGLEFGELRYLFHESLHGQLDTQFHRSVLARMTGMHRAEPEVGFPIELQPELDAFTPRTQNEQKGLDSYAKWDLAAR